MNTGGATGIQELLTALSRGWIVVLGCALVAWAIGYSNTADDEPVYQSDARLVVAPADLDETRDVIDTSAGLERESLVTTLAEVMTGTEMRRDASEDPRLADLDVDRYSTESAALPLSNVVTLSVRGPNPEGAQRLAVTLVRESSRYFETVYPIYRVDELDSPTRPSGAVAPKPARDGAMAAFGGAMLGIAIVTGALAWRRRAESEVGTIEPTAVDLFPLEVPRLVEVPCEESAVTEPAAQVTDAATPDPPTPGRSGPKRRRAPAKAPAKAPSTEPAAQVTDGATSDPPTPGRSGPKRRRAPAKAPAKAPSTEPAAQVTDGATSDPPTPGRSGPERRRAPAKAPSTDPSTEPAAQVTDGATPEPPTPGRSGPERRRAPETEPSTEPAAAGG